MTEQTTPLTDSPVDLIPAQEPDRTIEQMHRSAFVAQLDDSIGDDYALATFAGIGYELGVYMLAGCSGYAVAPTSIGGPVRAMARTDVRFFDVDAPENTLTVCYARACLWALRQVVTDVHAEFDETAAAAQRESEAQWADVEAGAAFDRDNPPNA
jgi:hypothetical protein